MISISFCLLSYGFSASSVIILWFISTSMLSKSDWRDMKRQFSDYSLIILMYRISNVYLPHMYCV